MARSPSNDRPSARAIRFVLDNARAYAPPGFSLSLATRVGDIPALAYRGAWATLLLGAGFDELRPVHPASEPETLEDVALHFDVLAAATEAGIAEDAALGTRPAPTMPPDFLAQLHRLEAERERAAGRTTIRGAVHADIDRSRPSTASWWKSASGDVVAVFDGTGGQHAGYAFARLIEAAMSEPEATSLADRARWPLERAHAAALAELGPAFVAFGTMASVAVEGARAAIAHVGDTRVARIRGDRCERLTIDHRLDLWGPGQRLVSRSIGMRDGFEIDVREVTRAPGDVLVLCTHDVWEMFDEVGLGAIVGAHGVSAPDAIVSRLAEAAPTRTGAVAIIVDEPRS